MITDRSLRSTKIGPGKVRWIHLLRSKEAGAVWIRLLSRRIGLLTDPLGVTGFMCGPLCGPYWLHHSIQFSRFRRSEGLRYWLCTPLSITSYNRFEITILCRKGIKNAPCLEASEGRATATVWRCFRYPIDLVHVRLLKILLHSVAEAAWLLYHRSSTDAID